MSGIAGMIRFDGQMVAPNDIASMTNLLTHRGKVTNQVFNQGILLSFDGKIEDNYTAGVYATTDADIFNQVDNDLPFVTGYIDTGPTIFNDLNADFAVALWDTRQHMLICARDILGVKPLYYMHHQGRFFAFASEIKALLILNEVAVHANQHKFKEYLSWTNTCIPYSDETFYEGIYSVLPGHYIAVSCQSETVEPQRYWKLDLKKFSDLSGPESYAFQFNAYFTLAVNERMRGKTKVGAHLSGGLDSSSVCCVAQSLLKQQNRPSLYTFNVDTGLASTNETEYVQEVINLHHPVHHTVHPEVDILDAILKINSLFDRPEHFIIPSSFHLSVSLKAEQIGLDCILTGHDGDSIISTASEYMEKLIEESDWGGLLIACQQFVSYPKRDLRYVSDNWFSLNQQIKFEKFVLHLIGSNITKRFREQSLNGFFKTLVTQKQTFGLSISTIVAYCTKRLKDKLLHTAFMDNALTYDFKQRVQSRQHHSTDVMAKQILLEHQVPISQIINTTNVICNEQLNHIGAYFGHQYSFPFFDKHVVELGLSTPLKIGFDHGRGRGLIRNGLEGILPSAIVSRLTKANFAEYGTISVQQLYQVSHGQFAALSHPIWEIIDRTKFSEIVAVVFNVHIPSQKKTRYNWLLSRIIYLALWLGLLPTKK